MEHWEGWRARPVKGNRVVDLGCGAAMADLGCGTVMRYQGCKEAMEYLGCGGPGALEDLEQWKVWSMEQRHSRQGWKSDRHRLVSCPWRHRQVRRPGRHRQAQRRPS